jgi:hypothetical protein
VQRERECIALIARLDVGNERVMDFHIVPDTTGQVNYLLERDDPWLRRGQPLIAIQDFIPVVNNIRAGRV